MKWSIIPSSALYVYHFISTNHYKFRTIRTKLLVLKIKYSRRKDTTRITWCISSQKKGIELLQTYFRYRWSILISVISELIGYVYEYKYVRDYLLYVLLYCMSRIMIMRKLLLLFLLHQKLFIYCVRYCCEKRNLFTIF